MNEPSSNNLQEQNIQAELDYVKLQSKNAGAIQEEAQELRYKKFTFFKNQNKMVNLNLNLHFYF